MMLFSKAPELSELYTDVYTDKGYKIRGVEKTEIITV